MLNEFERNIAKLEGYLEAVSALKADGSIFQAGYLGETSDPQLLKSLSSSLQIPKAYLEWDLLENGAEMPNLFKQWVLSRVRLFDPEDKQEIDRRLLDGFIAELADLFGTSLHWRRVQQVRNVESNYLQMAYGDIFVVDCERYSFFICCSWDS